MPIFDEWVLAPGAAGELPRFPVESETIARLLTRRGVIPDEFQRYTSPGIEALHDPLTIPNMGLACERIERAIRDREPVLIYGDYDVDGVTSIVLLKTVLNRLGGTVAHVVPHRLVDGYGLKIEVIERVLAERNVGLVVTVDCGISSVEPVRLAIERGIDVIITDHHLPPEELPAAAAVVNPKVGPGYPFDDLAGAGVAFKLACALLQRAGSKLSRESLLKIAALGTVADVAPLVGENRTIAQLGLAGLSDSPNQGLRALLQQTGLHRRTVRASDIGFKIGPRINAAGRLESADTAIDLFAAGDAATATMLAAKLNELNSRRQTVERGVLAACEEEISALGELPNVLVLSGEGWHRGVVGLCAGRLAQKYHRPVLVIAVEGERAVGSARSIPAVNLHGELSRQREMFEHFGGHELACGFSLPANRIGALREALTRQMALLPESTFRREATIDAEVSTRELTKAFFDEHQLLEPFGAANRLPLLLLRERVASLREFATDCLAVKIGEGSESVEAVLWPSRKALRPLMQGNVDLLVSLLPDRYAAKGFRAEIIDAAAAGEGPLRGR